MIKVDGQVITPTIFPDKTSQVWKLELDEKAHYTIEWTFENEAEFMHVAQLTQLIQARNGLVHLELPFLPYGRQDKLVSNISTFALHTFATLINSLGFSSITTLDAHSSEFEKYLEGPVFKNLYPEKEIEFAIKESGADLIGFPDAGAEKRYSTDVASIYGRKTRNQSNGYIEYDGIVNTTYPFPSKDARNVLIVDDICDGGMTFILFTKELKEKYNPKSIHLYVTHGIFSKGLEVLREAGIQRIFTKDGEIK